MVRTVVGKTPHVGRWRKAGSRRKVEGTLCRLELEANACKLAVKGGENGVKSGAGALKYNVVHIHPVPPPGSSSEVARGIDQT